LTKKLLLRSGSATPAVTTYFLFFVGCQWQTKNQKPGTRNKKAVAAATAQQQQKIKEE